MTVEEKLEKILEEKYGKEHGIKEFNLYIRRCRKIFRNFWETGPTRETIPFAMIKVLAIPDDKNKEKPKYFEICRATAVCGPKDNPSKKVFHSLTRSRLIDAITGEKYSSTALHVPYTLHYQDIKYAKEVPFLNLRGPLFRSQRRVKHDYRRLSLFKTLECSEWAEEMLTG